MTPKHQTPTATATATAAAAAATYRLTRLLTQDTLTAPLRNALFNRISPEHPFLSTPLPIPNPSYVLTCPHCASIYAAAAVSVAPRPLVRVLALSGVVCLIHDLLLDR